MKNYTITVNGTAYDVTVEETAGGAAPAPAAKAAPAAPAAAPAPPRRTRPRPRRKNLFAYRKDIPLRSESGRQ